MKNKIKQFLEARDITAYRFIKDTGISDTTGYRLAADGSYIPSAKVLEAICKTYTVQPGDLLEWLPGQRFEEAIDDEAKQDASQAKPEK